MSSAMQVLMKSDGFIFMRCLLQMVYPQKIKVHGNFFPLAEEQQSRLSLFLFLSLLHLFCINSLTFKDWFVLLLCYGGN